MKKRLLFIGFCLILCLQSFLAMAQKNKQVEKLREQIESYQISLNKAIQGKQKKTMAYYNTKIAFIYWEMQDQDNAIRFFERALAVHREVGNTMEVASINNNLGDICIETEKYQTALIYLFKARTTFSSKRNISALCEVNLKIAKAFQKQRKYAATITYLDSALQNARTIKDQNLTGACYRDLAENYRELGNTQKSQQYERLYMANAALEPPKNTKMTDLQVWSKLREAEARIKELEEQISNNAMSLEDKSKKLDSLSGKKGEYEKLSLAQESQIKALNIDRDLKESILKDREWRLQSETYLRNFLMVGAFIFLILTLGIFRALRQKQAANQLLSTQNTEIKQQQDEIMAQKDAISQKSVELQLAFAEINEKSQKITSSINYAKRIQSAILPSIESIRKALPESFIMFKPRDIVSGDFYWLAEKDFKPYYISKQIKDQTVSVLKGFVSQKIVIAAVDCTGHGVPGAFMSMIGVELLNEIVNVRNLTESNLILNEMHKGVRKALKKDETENRDGMDISLCIIDKEMKTLDFSGANNSLVYIKNNVLDEIRGDKQDIGGNTKNEKSRKFSKHQISVADPTYCYIFSDGYQDQFGGKENKKYMIRNLKDLLLKVHLLPMPEQEQILSNTMNSWMSNCKQIDDMLVIGFRFV
ncbi:MAG: hypothetical protein EAZ97_13585 [Bacteroidetes bacterium]|nr:MAG: hypothetical protein EAZ97_13585 [Bacteroidota bacterium]